MYPHSPEPFDPATKQPRGIPWTRWLLYAGGVLLVLCAATYLWIRSYVTITVAADTTVLTAPLLADGYPDYIGYLDAQNAAGVKPEENAWIAILRCCGPEEIDKPLRAEHYRKLGIKPLPDEGAYLRQFYDSQRLALVPEPVIIAASAAAQLPWHTRFVRLAALNAYRDSSGTTPPEGADPEPLESVLPMASISEQGEQALQIAAQAAWDFAEDAETANTLWFFESNAAAGIFVNDDEANIQDLRPEALAKIQPAFATPEEASEWRREIFKSTRELLWQREEMIMSERPWTREECPLGAHWVVSYSKQLDELHVQLQVRKKFYVPRLQKPGDPSMFGALLPCIQIQRLLALSYAYRANMYLGEQNHSAALNDLIAIMQVGALLPQHPALLEELVDIAVEGIGYAHLGPLIQSPALTDEQLATLEVRLAQIVRPFAIVDCLDHHERLMAIGQIIATVIRGDKNYFGFSKDQVDPQWERKIVDWNAVLRELNLRYDRYRDAAKTQDLQLINQAAQFNSTTPAHQQQLEENFKNPPWYLLPSVKTEVMKFKYAVLFSPHINSFYSAYLKGIVRRDLVRVMIALERFHRTNKTYPAALTELVPAYLPAVPTDPFDGKPIKYYRTLAGGYRAYSVWQNGTDEGGTPNVREDDDMSDYLNNDLVIGSPDEIPRKLNLAW